MRKLILALAVATVAVTGATTQTAQASSSCWYSVRGCVYVHGYFRSSGYYVSPYYRNYPYYRSYTYPSWRW